MNNAHTADGRFHSVRRMGESIVGLMQNRIDLFSVELQEEKLRAFSLVVWLTCNARSSGPNACV